jgi:hypothetical protein
MYVDGGADVGDVAPAAVEGVVDGEEVLGGKVIDPLDLDGVTASGLDDWAEGIGSVAPHARGGDVAMHLGVNLAHGDLEFGRRGFAEGRWKREWVDKGRQLEDVEHGGMGVRRIGHVLHARHCTPGV